MVVVFVVGIVIIGVFKEYMILGFRIGVMVMDFFINSKEVMGVIMVIIRDCYMFIFYINCLVVVMLDIIN